MVRSPVPDVGAVGTGGHVGSHALARLPHRLALLWRVRGRPGCGDADSACHRAHGGGTWVNLLGAEVGIGLWLTAELLEQIEHFGHYKHTGDVVRVTGVLNRTCETHIGEFDVHVHDLEIVSAGRPRSFVLRLEKAAVGMLGCVIGLILWLRRKAVRAAPLT